jgi:hypothetical protein
VTGEPKGQTEKWIEDKQAQYAYAYFDKSGGMIPLLGKASYPQAILVNPLGEIVWQGHPVGLSEAVIEEHLTGALPMPLFEFPKGASKVASALVKDQLGKALDAAKTYSEREGEQAAEILAAVEGHVDLRVGAITAAFEAGDFLQVTARGEPLVDALDDEDPRAIELAALLERVEDDEAAQGVIDAQEKLLELMEGLDRLKKKDQANSLIEKLQELAAEHPDTFVVGAAEAAIKRVRVLKAQLR